MNTTVYNPDYQKLLKFEQNDIMYKFLVSPNGYTEGPRKFTKVMKPPLALLRKKYSSYYYFGRLH